MHFKGHSTVQYLHTARVYCSVADITPQLLHSSPGDGNLGIVDCSSFPYIGEWRSEVRNLSANELCFNLTVYSPSPYSLYVEQFTGNINQSIPNQQRIVFNFTSGHNASLSSASLNMLTTLYFDDQQAAGLIYQLVVHVSPNVLLNNVDFLETTRCQPGNRCEYTRAHCTVLNP